MGFWRDYRAFVRDINPDAYLVGEVWWESWPDHMANPRPYIKGDVFDAVYDITAGTCPPGVSSPKRRPTLRQPGILPTSIPWKAISTGRISRP